MRHKRRLARIVLEEEENARIGAGSCKRVVDDAGLGFGDLRHGTVEGGKGVGVFGLAVDLEGDISGRTRKGGEGEERRSREKRGGAGWERHTVPWTTKSPFSGI